MGGPAAAQVKKLEAATRRLAAQSIGAYSNPHHRFTWPSRVPPDRLAMSAQLLPLAGHAIYAGLSDEQRWRLSLLETVNFFSINIAGERDLMTGLASRLYADLPVFISRYLQHFLHEENAHTVLFARFCIDYGGFIFEERIVRFAQQPVAGEEDFLFFARTLIFEEIAHFYNQRIAADEGVWALARDINRYHADDEARHIVFGRLLVAEMWERLGARWSSEDKLRIGGYLSRYLQSVQRSYVNADVYRSLGLPQEIRGEILASPHWAALSERSARGITRWLHAAGITPRPVPKDR